MTTFNNGHILRTLDNKTQFCYPFFKDSAMTLLFQSSTTAKVSDAINDVFKGTEDQAITLSAASLLSNDIAGTSTSYASSSWSLLCCWWSCPTTTNATLSLVSVQDATNGSVTLNNGQISFIPTANFNGLATFTYTIKDSNGNYDTAKVSLNICPVNDNPLLANDSASGNANTPITIASSALLSNDRDVDGDTLTISSVQNATHGSVSIVGGNVVFTPEAGYSGSASFTYTAIDGKGGSSTATVNVSLAPQAMPIAPVLDVASDTGIIGDFITTDRTPSLVVDNPSDLPVKLFANGIEVPSTYNPSNNTVTPVVLAPDGNYTLTYSLDTNGVAGPQSAPLTVTVDGTAPTMPVATPDMTAMTDTGTSNTDNNTDNRTPDFAVTVPANTSANLYVDGLKVPSTYNASAGTLTPANPIADGTHTVSYTLTDVAGNESAHSPTLSFVIGAQVLNHAPDAVNDTLTASSGTPIIINPSTLLANDTDADGDTLTITSVQNAQNGTVALVNGNIVFTPNAGYFGPAQFDYTINDGNTAGRTILASFDAGKYTTGQDVYVNGISPGWWSGNPDSLIEINQASVYGITGSTRNVVELERNSGDVANLVGDVATVPGKPIFISFDYSARAGHENDSGIDVFINGKCVGSVDTKTVGFTHIELTAIPDSTWSHIEFKAKDSNSYGGLLDDIKIESSDSGLSDTATVQLTITSSVPAAPVLDPASDSGLIGDYITTDRTPSLVVTNPSDLPVKLYANGIEVPSTYDAATNTVTPVVLAPDGNYTLTYSLLNNGIETPQSAPLTVTVDGTAPTAPLAMPDMTDASDTGLSNTDNNTDDRTPDFAVSVPSGTTANLYVDGMKVAASYNPTTGTLTPVNTLVDGTHSVTYTLTDVAGNESAPSPVLSVVVGAQITNTAPNAQDDSLIGTTNTAVVIPVTTLLANDNDIDGDDVSGVSVQNAVNGTVTYDGTNINFIPTTGYTGAASFTYTITDGKGGFDTATVTLDIQAPAPVNQAPDAKDDAVSGTADTPIVITPAALLANDSDINGDAITGVSIQDATHGTVTFDGTNVIFTPEAGYAGVASFSYTITDNKGGFDTATVNLTIAAKIPDPINGTSGDDVLNGGAGNDMITAGDGNDIIAGGAGNDTLNGGAGNDTFVWNLADIQGAGQELDTIQGANFGDKIDLQDLLQGESFDASTLESYLHFSTENGNTVIEVSANGVFNHGNQSGVNASCDQAYDQKIVIEGFDLTAGNTMSDLQVIQNLINANALITN